MDSPTQPVDRCGALCNKDFAAIHQQLQLAETSSCEAIGRSGSRRNLPRHRQRIDRVRLAPRACPRPRLAINFGGTRTTCCPALSRSRSNRADRCRQSSIAHTTSAPKRSRPHHRLGMPRARRGNDLFGEFAADLVDRDERVRALVYIGSNNNHGGCLLHCEVTVGPVGGHISVGAMPRSYQVTPAGPSHLMPTKRMHANPKAALTLEPDTRCSGSNHRNMRHLTLTLTGTLPPSGWPVLAWHGWPSITGISNAHRSPWCC